MNSFAEMLKKLMVSSGYSAYQLSILSGVNRTTIQRALTTGRIPQKNAFGKILNTLKLTDSEKRQLIDSYEIANDGEFKYNRRKYVKRLLERLSIPSDLTLSSFQIKNSGSISLFIPPPRVLVQGNPDVQLFIKLLISNELFKHGCSHLSIMLPMQKKIFHQIFTGLHEDTMKQLHISQLIYMIKRPESNEKYELYNLELLSNILPLALRSIADYKVYYSYTDSALMSDTATGFPYYILFSNYILLLSSDLETAWFEDSPQLVYYYKNLFSIAQRQGRELITSFNSLPEYLQKSLETDHNALGNYSIEYQPCFLSFCTPKLIDAFAIPGIPDRNKMVDLTLNRIAQFNSLDKNVIIFNSNSLKIFIEDGIIISIPQNLARPCNLKERLFLLEQLELCCRKERHTVRAVNSKYFNVGKQIYISLLNDKTVSIYTYDLDCQKFRLVELEENTIYEAFYDFIHYITQSDTEYLFSQKETLDIIIRYKEKLIQKMQKL